jgi:predicted nuclease with RNAse H fold
MESTLPCSVVVAGIDVGGPRKGFHAVAVSGTAFRGKIDTGSAAEVAGWCREVGALVVAVDAPCAWSASGRARASERELMREGISCFSTPTASAAQAHPRNYFGWMLAGARLYEVLRSTYPLLESAGLASNQAACFETFPQAIACRLSGCLVSAREKNATRRGLLRRAGFDASWLANIDEVDAALCALMAQLAVRGEVDALGDAAEGFIFVPRRRPP